MWVSVLKKNVAINFSDTIYNSNKCWDGSSQHNGSFQNIWSTAIDIIAVLQLGSWKTRTFQKIGIKCFLVTSHLVQAVLYWYLYKTIVGFSFISDIISKKVDTQRSVWAWNGISHWPFFDMFHGMAEHTQLARTIHYLHIFNSTANDCLRILLVLACICQVKCPS